MYLCHMTRACFAGLLWRTALGGQALADKPETAAIDRPAPSFGLFDMSGKRRVLLDYRRSAVLAFSSWRSPACRQALPAIARLARGSRLEFLLIDVTRKLDAEAYRGISMTVLHDDDQAVARLYQVETVPACFLIDELRTLRYAGSVDGLRVALGQFQAGHRIAKPRVVTGGDPLPR